MKRGVIQGPLSSPVWVESVPSDEIPTVEMNNNRTLSGVSAFGDDDIEWNFLIVDDLVVSSGNVEVGEFRVFHVEDVLN